MHSCASISYIVCCSTQRRSHYFILTESSTNAYIVVANTGCMKQPGPHQAGDSNIAQIRPIFCLILPAIISKEHILYFIRQLRYQSTVFAKTKFKVGFENTTYRSMTEIHKIPGNKRFSPRQNQSNRVCLHFVPKAEVKRHGNASTPWVASVGG